MAIESEKYHIPNTEHEPVDAIAETDSITTIPVETEHAEISSTTESPVDARRAKIEEINARLGEVNERVDRLRQEQAQIASKFSDMQGAQGAEYTQAIEAATFTLSQAEEEQRQLLKELVGVYREPSLLRRLGNFIRNR